MLYPVNYLFSTKRSKRPISLCQVYKVFDIIYRIYIAYYMIGYWLEWLTIIVRDHSNGYTWL